MTVTAVSAVNVGVGGDLLAHGEAGDARTELIDRADQFMTRVSGKTALKSPL